ncbi:MAG: RelA/SpoT family protein [Holosporales bacterium]|nr:RelA/SpoT family protein [Holosporales bacterium]
MISQQALINGITEYVPDANIDLIKKAYVFALEYHGTQLRDSGDPFVSHPLEVASMLIALKMDVTTVIAGLLHDTVEDTSATISQIKDIFGNDVAKIVNGVTKLSQLETSSITEKQTENFKKLLISAAADIRVLIIKLIDRLHNMRTLRHRPEPKRQKVAKETLDVYAPLAERIGISTIKDELQDIAFMELYPSMYNSIMEKLKDLYEHSSHVVETISSKIEELASELGIQGAVIGGRLKTPYSIWQKMSKRNISFEQLSDIMAFRIVVDTVPQCYQMLGILHRNYVVIPGRFRDYISTPKSNRYQSLHTSVIGPLDRRIEVQIRTKEMHRIAEYGIAAHWNYKESSEFNISKKKNYKWLRNMVEILDGSSGLDEFLENSKNEMLSGQIFCISPKGKIIVLPKGATVLDFAYTIHSEVGNHAIGAKVNGADSQLETTLLNGDQVEIITDQNSFPKYSWYNHIVTIKAKTHIRKAIEETHTKEISSRGENMMRKFIRESNLSISEEDYEKIMGSLQYQTKDQIYHAVGVEKKTPRELMQLCQVFTNSKEQNNKSVMNSLIDVSPEVIILPTNCCFPVPGDKIVGIQLNEESGIEIHSSECAIMKTKASSGLYKITKLHWRKEAFNSSVKHLARLSITIKNHTGYLSQILTIIEQEEGNILNVKNNEKSDNTIEIVIEVYVKNLSHLRHINAAIRNCNFIIKVERS